MLSIVRVCHSSDHPTLNGPWKAASRFYAAKFNDRKVTKPMATRYHLNPYTSARIDMVFEDVSRGVSDLELSSQIPKVV
jgi:hypothetical protein